jgi:hypothetical protein
MILNGHVLIIRLLPRVANFEYQPIRHLRELSDAEAVPRDAAARAVVQMECNLEVVGMLEEGRWRSAEQEERHTDKAVVDTTSWLEKTDLEEAETSVSARKASGSQ